MRPKGVGATGWAIRASLALFLASLFFPALRFQDHSPVSGGQALAWGWWGLLTGDLAWFANPAYLAGLILISRRRVGGARIAAVGALGLASLSVLAGEWWFNEGSGTPITGLGLAFYIWMASLASLLVGTLLPAEDVARRG